MEMYDTMTDNMPAPRSTKPRVQLRVATQTAVLGRRFTHPPQYQLVLMQPGGYGISEDWRYEARSEWYPSPQQAWDTLPELVQAFWHPKFTWKVKAP